MSEPVLERIARVEGRVEEHSRMVEDFARRFTNMEARFQHLEDRFDARFDHLDSKMTSYFTWMVGLTLASWLTLMYQFSRVPR